MGFGLTRRLALFATAAVVALPSSAVLAQSSPNQLLLQSLVQNIRNPHSAKPNDVSSVFISTIGQVTKPQQQNPPPDLDPSAGVDPETTQSQLAQKQRQEQQRQEQQRQQQAEKDRLRQQAFQLIAQIEQAMQALQQANRQEAAQKQAGSVERYLSQLTDEERRAYQQRVEEASRRAQQQIQDRNQPTPEPDWLEDFPYFRDGVLTGSTPEWESWWVTYQGLIVGTAADDSSLTGSIQFDIDNSGELFGEMMFDGSAGSVTFEGALDELGRIDAQTGAGGNNFFGGIVPGQQGGAVLGHLYGPNAENAGGNWSFNVSGGAKPGSASGQFGAGMVEQEGE